MSLNLTPRLSAVASLVKGGGIVADIGTDHAYLPVYLIETGKITGAIAADIRKGPLENAAKTVEKYGCSNQVDLRLSDGLRNFKPHEVSEIVFAGMGGTLIAEKLAEAQWTEDGSVHFVFQPQSKAEDLRRYLYTRGFEIGTEIATCEGERPYIAFDAVYTGEKRDFTIADCYLGKLPKTDAAFMHIEKQINRLQKKYSATAQAGFEDGELLATIQKLKEFTND